MKTLKNINLKLERCFLEIIKFIQQIRAVLLVLIAAGILIFYLYGIKKSEIQLFPFDSVRWGDVSGWLSLLITIISIGFIYSTFRLQQKITFIEDRKYRFGLLPEITLAELPDNVLDRKYAEFGTEGNGLTLEDEFDFRINFEHKFIKNAQLITADKKEVLKNKSIHLKSGVIYLESKYDYFKGKPLARINDIDGKGLVSYKKLIIRIEDRDGVCSDIYIRIRLKLLLDKATGNTKGRIDKLSILKYDIGTGVNMGS